MVYFILLAFSLYGYCHNIHLYVFVCIVPFCAMLLRSSHITQNHNECFSSLQTISLYGLECYLLSILLFLKATSYSFSIFFINEMNVIHSISYNYSCPTILNNILQNELLSYLKFFTVGKLRSGASWLLVLRLQERCTNLYPVSAPRLPSLYDDARTRFQWKRLSLIIVGKNLWKQSFFRLK